MFLQCAEIGGFVEESPVLPATKNDSNLLESQRANDGLMGLSALAPLLVEGLRPERVMDRLVGPLDEGLAKKLRAAPAPVD